MKKLRKVFKVLNSQGILVILGSVKLLLRQLRDREVGIIDLAQRPNLGF